MTNRRLIEIFLAQVVVYLLIWVFNSYLALVLSSIFAGICLLILLVALAVELIERSKVPRWYYYLMIVSTLAPLLAMGVYFAFGGDLSSVSEFG
ncbi:MAG: hypothetical protein SH848_04755 [Saprospiraceae bacterium]|nr:hypothetical protein [Saprospiraceae bacterium]MDZ4703214.1 hypothetical protein [Saprospiraceae bacterium]